MPNLVADSNDPNVAAIHGTHTNGAGGPAAIIGQSEGRGVLGVSGSGQGVWGHSTSSTGVVGISETSTGVGGKSTSAVGVLGESEKFQGVRGVTKADGHGAVVGENVGATNGIGIYGVSRSAPLGAGVMGENTAGGFAGYFKGKLGVTRDLVVDGDVQVAGDIRLVNADCAEDFDVAGVGTAEPGTVMVLGEGGALKPSDRAYDKRVAGVVSGAGGYKPGIVLDRQPAKRNRSPIALLGKVYCKVDAGQAPVEMGDLLTTSDTPGHAMKAGDSTKAFGSVIGKALRPLAGGRGLIPVLIALR